MAKQLAKPDPRRLLARWALLPVRALLSLLFSLFLFIVLGLLLLFLSEDGVRLSHRAVQELLSDQITIERMEGRLSGPLTLHGIHYRNPAIDLFISRAYLEWKPQALFRGRLRITLLELETVQLVTMGESESSEPASGLPEVNLPFGLDLDLARVTDFRMTSDATQDPTELSVLEVAGSLTGSELTLTRLLVDLPDLSLNSEGQARLSQDYPLQLALDWSYRGLPGGRVEGQGDLQGDLQQIQLRQTLGGAAEASLTLQIEDPVENPRIDGALKLASLNPAQLDPGWPAVALGGDLKVSGGLQALTLTGELSAATAQYGTLVNGFELVWNGSSVILQRLEVRSDAGLFLSADGQWSPDSGENVIAARGEWKELVWPLTGEPEWRSSEGRFSVTGVPSDYRFELSGEMGPQEFPPAGIILFGEGDLGQVRLTGFQVDTLGGRIDGQGRVSWSPEINGSVAVTAQALNPGRAWAEWPGVIGGRIEASARLVDGELLAQLQIPSVSGSLRDYPLDLKGALSLQGETLRISNLALRSGPTKLDASGSLSDRWDLKWSLSSPDLASLLPEAAGEIDATGSLVGLRALPGLSAEFSGKALSYREQRIKDLDGSVSLDPEGAGKLHARIEADDIVLGGNRWSSIRLAGDGTLEAHRLTFSARGKPIDLDVAVRAGLHEAKEWRGVLTGLDIASRDFGEWRLDKPGSFQLSQQHASLERSCLVEGKARLCIQAGREENGQAKGALTLERLSLEKLGPLLPDGVELTGTVKADSKFHLDAAGELKANLNLAIPVGRSVLMLGREPRNLDFSGSRLQLSSDSGGLNGSLSLALSRNGGLDGGLRLPGWSIKDPLRQDQAMTGELKAQLDDLGLFAGLVPGVTELSGRIAADLKVSGSLGQPGIKGHAWLKDAGGEYTPLGLKLEQVRLEVRNKGLQELIFNGGLVAGEGSLEITGATRLQGADGWPTRFTVQGDELTIADIPEAWLLVSPDLQITMEGRQIALSGEVFIPQARIRPRQIPEQAVASSPDLRFVNKADDRPVQPPFQVNASIRVRMGDRVSFDGFGLRGLIRGNLLLTDEPGRPTLGNGQLRIEEGTYKAYGQDLKIRQGQAIFANSLVTNPGIAVIAVRSVKDVEAGVNVSGTLKKPVLKVFSTPAMSQSDALGYLLFGQPLGRTSSTSDQERMQSAANALAVGGGGLLAAEIGRQFGLDELSLQSGDKEGDLALHLGAYLSPRIYIQYISELSTSSNQVKLRYDLTEKIQVQTETGTVHGADIFYTIEK